MLRVLVLISGGGSNLRALLEESADAGALPTEAGGSAGALRDEAGDKAGFPARIVAIGADRDAEGLQHGEDFGIPAFTVPFTAFDSREEWGAALLEQIRQWTPDLVVLSGFMRLLPPSVVRALAPALINTHPAYLPEFPGAHAVRDAIAAGATQSGASVIVVDDGVDTGPILVQERIAVDADDTEDTLHEKIKVVERRLLIETVRGIAEGRIPLTARTQTF